MGSLSSKAAKKVLSPIFGDDSSAQGSEVVKARHAVRLASPFVFSRKGSMYFDQDGDLAHEFYEEVSCNRPGEKKHMKRIFHNLTPQGEVEYSVPRLHPDFHMIMCPT